MNGQFLLSWQKSDNYFTYNRFSVHKLLSFGWSDIFQQVLLNLTPVKALVAFYEFQLNWDFNLDWSKEKNAIGSLQKRNTQFKNGSILSTNQSNYLNKYFYSTCVQWKSVIIRRICKVYCTAQNRIKTKCSKLEKQILIFTKCQSKPSVMSSLFKETTVVNWNILIEFLGKTNKERKPNVKIMIEVKKQRNPVHSVVTFETVVSEFWLKHRQNIENMLLKVVAIHRTQLCFLFNTKKKMLETKKHSLYK